MKRILAMVLGLILLFGFSGTALAGKAVETIFKNPGFEEGNESWLPYGGQWEGNQNVAISTKRAHSGKASLYIKDEEKKNEWARQLIPMIGGALYRVTAYLYVDKGTKGQPLIKFEGYNDSIISSETGTDATAVKLTGVTGEWTKVEYEYRAHMNTKYVAVYLRLMDDVGEIYFDDISVELIKKADAFKMDLNSYNYYVTEKTGYADISANVDQYSEFNTWNISCTIKDEASVLWESEKLPFTKQVERIAFPLEKCDVREKAYIFTTKVIDSEGKVVQEKQEEFLRKYDRPSIMSENGLHLDENGEIFHPISAYHLYGDAVDKYAKDFGINVVQLVYDYADDPEAAIKELDRLHAMGIKAIVCLYYRNIICSDDFNLERTKKCVEVLKGHPGIYAWGIQDEPVGKNTDEKLVIKAYRTVREIDTIHPVYCIDQREWMYPQLIRNVDILSIDNYPYGALDAMEYVYNSTKYAVDLAGISKKPVAPILQFFRRGSGKFTKDPIYYPSGNAMRNMMYQVLMAGANGFGFYAFDEKVNGVPVMDTETGTAIKEFMKNEKDLVFDYFVEKKYPTFCINHTENKDIRYEGFIKDGEIYLIVLNRHEYTETEVSIPLISDNGLVKISSFTAEGYAGGAENARGIQTLSVKLAPGAAQVYKIKPANRIDINKLKEEVVSFDDIADYTWAKTQIESLYKKGIVNMPAEGKFLPGEKITRGDFAYFLVRTLGLETEETELFADVPEDSFYAKEIATGKAAGILKGVGENSYAPDAEISRQDIMTLIARGLELKGETDLSSFSDADKIAEYAKEGVKAMIAEGLIEGYADGTLNPLGNTTRAEAAVIMHRILERL